MMVISILRKLADAPAPGAPANPKAPAADPPRPVATVEAKSHPAAPVLPQAVEPKAPSLAAFGSSLL